MKYFNSVDEFYINFYKFVNNDLNEFFKKNEDVIKKTKIKFPFYTIGLESSAAEVGFGWLNGLIMINQLHR